MPKKLLGLAASLVLAGCMPPPMENRYPELPIDQKTLAIDGMEFAAPGEPGWHLHGQTRFGVDLGKLGPAEDETTTLSAGLYKTPPAATGKDWTQLVKEGEDADTDPKRFVVTLHDVEPVTVGGVACARSHSVAEDHAAKTHSGRKDVMILEILSLNCRHPDDPRVGVNVGYSQRYYPGQGDQEFMKKGLSLLSSVHFTKLVEN